MLGSQLRALRKRKGLSLGEVARRGGFDKGTVCAWEHDRISPRTDNLIKLLRALGATFRDLRLPRSKRVA